MKGGIVAVEEDTDKHKHNDNDSDKDNDNDFNFEHSEWIEIVCAVHLNNHWSVDHPIKLRNSVLTARGK